MTSPSYCQVEMEVLYLSVTGCVMVPLNTCSLGVLLGAVGHYGPDLTPCIEFFVNSSVRDSPWELWLTSSFGATGRQRIRTCVLFPLSCSPQTPCPRHFLQATSSLCTDTQGLRTGTQPKFISYVTNRSLNYNLLWHWGCWCQSKSAEPTCRLQLRCKVCAFAATDAAS